MKKITRIAAVAALTMGAAAMLQPANAICTSPRLFNSGTSYVITSGCEGGGCGSSQSSITDDITGVFWAIGDGDATPALGIDSGLFPFSGGWGYVYAGYPALINSTWAADPRIDGCIDFAADPQRCMAILLMDTDPTSGEGAFALATKEPDNLGNYDFTQDGDIVLSTLSTLRITGSARIADGLSVDVTVGGVALSDIQGSLYLDPACPQPAGGGIPGVIQGYQVFSQSVARNAPAPTSNAAADWTAVGPVTPLGDPLTVNFTCDGETDKYITNGIVFDSNYRNVWVSGQSLKVECGANLADPDHIAPHKPRNREVKPSGRTTGR